MIAGLRGNGGVQAEASEGPAPGPHADGDQVIAKMTPDEKEQLAVALRGVGAILDRVRMRCEAEGGLPANGSGVGVPGPHQAG